MRLSVVEQGAPGLNWETLNFALAGEPVKRVANGPYGADNIRPIVVQRAPDVTDMDIDSAELDFGFRRPARGDEIVTTVHHSWHLHKMQKQSEL